MQVIGLCEKKRDPQPKHIIADTPGQIEIFTWSASGAIITEVLGAAVKSTAACLHTWLVLQKMVCHGRPLQSCNALHLHPILSACCQGVVGLP